MKQARLLRGGLRLQHHVLDASPLTLISTRSSYPPPTRAAPSARDSPRARDGGSARGTSPSDSKTAPPAVVVVPDQGWLWRTGKAGSASTTVADLRQDHIRPKKSLGQNFVTDDSVLEGIVEASGVQPGDLVLEIGPGTGNLTRHLLAAGATVTALEKDDVLYARLVDSLSKAQKLKVLNGDVLKVNLGKILEDMMAQTREQAAASEASTTASDPSPTASTSAPEEPSSSSPASAPAAAAAAPVPAPRRIKVVANLPYNITKEFLKLMLPLGSLVSELHIMIQEEVARRLVTRTPGGADYRAMNLRVLFYSRPKYRFLIPKGKYFPVPGVDGALVSFRLLPPGLRLATPSDRGFINLVNKAFSERRKMMRNSLQPLYTYAQAERGLAAAGLLITARAQDLTVEQFTRFHRELHAVVLQELAENGPPQDEAAEEEDGAAVEGGAGGKRRKVQVGQALSMAARAAAAAAIRDGQEDLADSDSL